VLGLSDANWTRIASSRKRGSPEPNYLPPGANELRPEFRIKNSMVAVDQISKTRADASHHPGQTLEHTLFFFRKRREWKERDHHCRDRDSGVITPRSHPSKPLPRHMVRAIQQTLRVKGLKKIAEAGREILDVDLDINPVLILTGRELFGQFDLGEFSKICGADARLARGMFMRGEIRELFEFTQKLYLGMPSRHEVHQDKIRKRAAKKNAKAVPSARR
jgi:hypothetical protein